MASTVVRRRVRFRSSSSLRAFAAAALVLAACGDSGDNAPGAAGSAGSSGSPGTGGSGGSSTSTGMGGSGGQMTTGGEDASSPPADGQAGAGGAVAMPDAGVIVDAGPIQHHLMVIE